MNSMQPVIVQENAQISIEQVQTEFSNNQKKSYKVKILKTNNTPIKVEPGQEFVYNFEF